MFEYLKKVTDQIGGFLKELSTARKAGLMLLSVIVAVGISMMFFWAGDRSFNALMTNLNPEDAANIMRMLRDKKIPFRVDSSGRNISVPPEAVDIMRIELATIGLPQSGVVGYEVFDKQSLGATSFVQKLNEKRAREGELMRTIATIRGVKRSRVHLAIPSKSTFIEDQKKPTASVVLDLEPGSSLHEKQIHGIQNLVARAIEGMDTSDVVIVDSIGKILSKNNDDPVARATATQLEYRQRMEGDLERSIEQMIGRVVGDGRVVARVSADLDFSQTQETQTTYDGDASAVRSNQKNLAQSDQNRPGARGAPGARSNLPGELNPTPVIGTNTTQNNEVTNYAIPETTRRTHKATGQVRKLSVAVMVDGKKVKVTDKDGNVETKTEAWSPEKMAEFEAIVSNAVGLDRKRGDVIEIKGMDFASEDFDEAAKIAAEKERKSYIQNLVLYGVIALTIVLFFFLVVRPFIKWITENTIDSVESFLPQTIEELEKMQKNTVIQSMDEIIPEFEDRIDPEKVEGEMLKEKIISMVDNNPQKAALILRDWMHELADLEETKKAASGKGA